MIWSTYYGYKVGLAVATGMHILFNANEAQAGLFLKRIRQQAPKQATIISSHLHKTTDKNFHDFTIIVEGDNRCKKQALLSPFA